jgi:hypothetical protein
MQRRRGGLDAARSLGLRRISNQSKVQFTLKRFVALGASEALGMPLLISSTEELAREEFPAFTAVLAIGGVSLSTITFRSQESESMSVSTWQYILPSLVATVSPQG